MEINLCASTLNNRVNEKDVTACITMAATVIITKVPNKSPFLFGITSSKSALEVYGKTSPEKLRMTIKNNPIPTSFFLGQMYSLNAHLKLTSVILSFFLPMRECRRKLSQKKQCDVLAEKDEYGGFHAKSAKVCAKVCAKLAKKSFYATFAVFAKKKCALCVKKLLRKHNSPILFGNSELPKRKIFRFSWFCCTDIRLLYFVHNKLNSLIFNSIYSFYFDSAFVSHQP